MIGKHEPLLQRHEKNPILTASDWPYPVHTVFNPGATRLRDGSTLLLCRVEDHTGISHLCAARSPNGVDGWVVDAAAALRPDASHYPEEIWGLEDPRITYVEELGKYVVAFVAFSKSGPGVAIATTDDFRSYERHGLVMQPQDKDAALLPRRINGSFALIHRPMANSEGHVWISFSPDLRAWGGHKLMLPARKGGYWDANHIGLTAPLIETARGWLMLYHGVRHTASGALYRVGLALFALDHPERCLLRGNPWLFGPETAYEREGDVGNVVFPTGYTLDSTGDTINLYYGAADSSVALATASIRELLHWLDENGHAPDDEVASP